MRSLYFYSIILGFFAGIFAVSSFSVSAEALGASAFVAVVVVVFLLFHSRYKQKPLAHPVILVATFICMASLGGILLDVKLEHFDQNPLADYAGREVALIGTALDDTSATDSGAVIRVYALSSGDQILKIRAQSVLLRFPGLEFKYGDTVAVRGRLEPPQNFEDEAGRVFDYASFLRKSDISYTLERPDIIHHESGDTTLTSLLYAIKRWFIGNVERYVPEPESALASGVAISGKGALPKEVKDDFINAGLIHIVVLSGYNIAIVIRVLLSMFGFAGRRWAIATALSGVLLFVVISGGAAPVVRAAIMASITLIGTLSYTSVLQNRALWGAALIMVLWNPLILTSDASFALSFLATFAIINVVPIIKPYFSWATNKWHMRETLSETMATQIFVLPYLLYQIGKFSVVAPLSNVIVLPLIPIIMMLTFAVGIAGSLGYLSIIALPVGAVLYLISHLVIWISHIFSSLPFSAFNLTIPLSIMVLVYAIYLSIGYYFRASMKRLAATS